MERVSPTERNVFLALMTLVGVVGASFATAFGIITIRDHLRFPAAPTATPLRSAVDRQWVRLDRAIVDCTSRYVFRNRTYFVGWDDSAPFIAACEGEIACADVGSRVAP